MSSIPSTLPASVLLQSTAAPTVQVPALGTTGNASLAPQASFNTGLSAAPSQSASDSDVLNMMFGMMTSMFQMFMQVVGGNSGAAGNLPLAGNNGLSVGIPLTGSSGLSAAGIPFTDGSGLSSGFPLVASNGLSTGSLLGSGGTFSAVPVTSLTGSLAGISNLAASGMSGAGLFPASGTGLFNSGVAMIPSTASSLPLFSGMGGVAGVPIDALASTQGLAAVPGTVAMSGNGVIGSGTGAAAIGYDPEGATERPGVVASVNLANQAQMTQNASNVLGQQISNISAGFGTMPTAGLQGVPVAGAGPAVAATAPLSTSTGASAVSGYPGAATSTTVPSSNPGTASLLSSMIDICRQLLSSLGGSSPQASPAGYGDAPAPAPPSPYGGTPAPAPSAYGATPAPAPTPSSAYCNTSDPSSLASTQGASNTTTTPSPSVSTQFSQDDAKNYILGSTQGGKITQEASIFSKYADPNSRFAQIGDTNEFDAVVEKIYAAQFAGYAQGLDIVYSPGKDINLIAGNIAKSQDAYNNLNPDAKLFADVAATYRGDFGNRGAYNNPELKNLLVSWGRSDLAGKELVGNPNADAQTIGAVTQALNEQQDPAIRQAWMQQIFDFQNNTPNSPTGAVPDVANYQKAIGIVKSGVLDQLMSNYNQGIGTTGAIA